MATFRSSKVKRMMDEDECSASAGSLAPGFELSPQATKKRRTAQSPRPDAKRIKLHFDGRVYRSLSETSPSSRKGKGKAYAGPDEILGAPDERPVDALYEAINSSPFSDLKQNHADLRVYDAQNREKEPSEAGSAASDLEVGLPNLPDLNEDLLADTDVDHFALPKSYENLLNLQVALERALMLYLSTEGRAGQVASAVSTAAKHAVLRGEETYSVKLHNLASLVNLRSIVERASGRRFGEKELAQLLWLWQQKSRTGVRNEFGLVVTRMSERSGVNATKTTSYGIGLELTLKRNSAAANQSTIEIVGCPINKQTSSGASTTHRDGMSVVATWSQGSEHRKLEMRKRMILFLLRERAPRQDSGAQNIVQDKKTPTKISLTLGMLPTPPATAERLATTESVGTSEPPIPMADLPNIHTAASKRASVGDQGRQSDAKRKNTPSPAKAGPAKSRASGLLERIKAKEQAQLNGDFGDLVKAPNLGLLSPTRKSLKSNTVMAARERARMAAYKRKSTLSRLPDVADALFMLFSANATPPSPSASMPNPPTRHRKAMPLDDVSVIISKSSKIALSEGEANGAIRLLLEICPTFVKTRRIEGRDWLSVVQPGERLNLGQCKDTIRKELLLDM